MNSKNSIFYSSSSLTNEKIKYSGSIVRNIKDLIFKFFNDEKVAEIEVIDGSSKTTFELRIVWKQLQVILKVHVNHFGKATFNFTLPNNRGFDKLIFEFEDKSTIEKLLNSLNNKKTGSAATHLVGFKIDTNKNNVYTTFTLTIFNEFWNGVIYKEEEQQNLFKKLWYLIFSNSLLRIKSWMHMFHFLIRFPNLSVENMLKRTDLQLKSRLKVDNSRLSHFGKSFNEDIVISNKNIKVSKTPLGKGGFGTVRHSMVYNKYAAIKVFDKRKENIIETGFFINDDSISEITFWRLLNSPMIFKFYGINFINRNEENIVSLFTSYSQGEKLTKWYTKILEEWPSIIYNVILDLSATIAYIHSRGVFHGDLSLSNIIVDYSLKSGRSKITLIDFGMSGDIKEDPITGLTVDFGAYEILTKEFRESSKTKIDVFAIGSIMIHLFYRVSFVSILMKNWDSNILNKQVLSNF